MDTKDAQPTIEELKAEAAANRARLTESVGALAEELQPRNLAKATFEDAKTFVSSEFENAKSQIKDEYGWRVDRLIAVGGAVLGVVTFVLTVRAIVNRSRGRKLLANPRKAIEG